MCTCQQLLMERWLISFPPSNYDNNHCKNDYPSYHNDINYILQRRWQKVSTERIVREVLLSWKTVVAYGLCACANTLIDLLQPRHISHFSTCPFLIGSLFFVSCFRQLRLFSIPFGFLVRVSWIVADATINQHSVKNIILANATNCSHKIILTYGYLTLQVPTI